METSCTVSFRGGTGKIVGLSALKESDAWRQAFASKAKDHRFYEIIEETLDSGFEHHYLVLEDESGRVRAIQPLFLVRQNLVEGVPSVRRLVDSVRRLFPRFLTTRIMMVGCAAGEGHLGTCAEGDDDWVAIGLHATLEHCARHFGAALIVFKDFPASYRELFERFSENGYARVPSMPLTTLALRHADFDEYLNSLGSSTRKDLRRKFRRIEKAAPIELSIPPDVTPYVDDIYPLYLEVHERSDQRFETLTRSYFRALAKQMPDRAKFFLWRQGGRVIAFSLCLVHDGVIYDDYLGLNYAVALDLHLYFKTIRDVLAWALAEGLHSYRSSPLNYRPKLHLGCSLLPLDLYVMHTNRWLKPIFRHVLPLVGPTRHDPVLKQFPNAHEL